jgi:hypothetical protein
MPQLQDSQQWSCYPNSRYVPSECCPVSRLIKVLLPTDGNPMNPLGRVSSPLDQVRVPLHTGHTSPGNIEASTSTAATCGWCQKLAFQLCKLCLELSCREKVSLLAGGFVIYAYPNGMMLLYSSVSWPSIQCQHHISRVL